MKTQTVHQIKRKPTYSVNTCKYMGKGGKGYHKITGNTAILSKCLQFYTLIITLPKETILTQHNSLLCQIHTGIYANDKISRFWLQNGQQHFTQNKKQTKKNPSKGKSTFHSCVTYDAIKIIKPHFGRVMEKLIQLNFADSPG